MTDNDIVKALECCTKGAYAEVCEKCAFRNEENKININCFNLEKYALDLINRQKAEIERLQTYHDDMEGAIYSFREDHAKVKFFKKEIKAEAYKKFAEKANEVIDLIVDLMFDDNISKCQLLNCHKSSSIPCGNEICIQENKEYWHSKLDNLLKELIGE